MPSTNKTPFLNLNSWLGTDKPKKDDFNADNQKIDEAIKNHYENMQAHITPAERALWNSGAFVIGSYTGTGTNIRDINLGFTPRFGIIFAADTMPIQYLSGSRQNYANMCIMSPSGCSTGCTLTAGGFKVQNSEENAPDGISAHLNSLNLKYIYMVYR